MITSNDIKQANERISQAWNMVRSLQDLSRQIESQLNIEKSFLDKTEEDLKSLNDQLEALREKENNLLSEIAALNTQILDLQKELESRPIPKPEPEPEPDPNKIITTIPFIIKDTTGQGRLEGEYAFTGIPLAEPLSVKDVNQLRVTWYGVEGNPIINSDIRPTAYWPTGNIQWVQVVFAVEKFTGSVQYELLVYEKPQALITPLIHVSSTSKNVLIQNGTLPYEVNISGIHQKHLSSDGINVTFDGKTSNDDALRRVYVEYSGPLICYVIVEGITDLAFSFYESKGKDTQGKPLTKPASISFRRRYQFLAKSPLVICQESLYWEGSFNGTSHEKDQPEKPYGQRDPNAVLGSLWRERFKLTSKPKFVRILDIETGTSWNAHPEERIISLEQTLRPQRLVSDKTKAIPTSFKILSDAKPLFSGENASGVFSVEVSNNEFVTVALKDMCLHEPQAIRLVGNEIQLDLASDKFWLPHHSGVEVTYAIHASDKQPDLNHIWRQVNKPLRAIIHSEWYNESGGFNCIGGILVPSENFDNPDLIQEYDKVMSYTVNNTITKMQAEGFQGLMTWGSVPRYWEEWGFNSGEMGSGIGPWDELLRNWTGTDYWCTFKLALEWAIRSGEVQWIEELTIPAASRMLHTQIMQAAPDDSFFYAGQAPAGYSIYRSDMNSSHQYWENLYLYYLITGDRTVIDVTERGALSQINYMNDKKGVTGRQPMQWLQAYLFLSYCHYAEGSRLTFGRAFDMFMKDAIANHYLEADFQGEKEAIWTQQRFTTPSRSGTYETHQLFGLAFYDMEILHHFGLRNPSYTFQGAKPVEMMVNIAKTIIRRGIGSESKNVETSAWLRIFSCDYDGKGNFTRFEGGSVDNQKILFPDDKGTMCTFFSRCAWLSNDPVIKRVSRELVNLIFKQVAGRGLPFGKLIGMLMSRLSAAVTIEQMIEERDKADDRK